MPVGWCTQMQEPALKLSPKRASQKCQDVLRLFFKKIINKTVQNIIEKDKPGRGGRCCLWIWLATVQTPYWSTCKPSTCAMHVSTSKLSCAVLLAWNGLSVASNLFKSHFPKETCLSSQAPACQTPTIG